MSPLKVTGHLTEKKQAYGVPAEFEDGSVAVYKLGKDIHGQEIIACLQGKAGVGVDYEVIGKAWIFKGEIPTVGEDDENRTKDIKADLRILNPNTKDRIDAIYIKGKERG